MWKIQKFRETTRKTAFVKVWVPNQKYEHVVQASFKILIVTLEEKLYENATSLINKQSNFLHLQLRFETFLFECKCPLFLIKRPICPSHV